MKLLVALALIAVAYAFPEPVVLPEAPVPLEEDVKSDAESVVLSDAELPAYEDAPVYEPVDISPMIIDEEVLRAVRLELIAENRAAEAELEDNVEEEPMDAYDGEPVEVAYDVDDIPVDDTVNVAQSPDEIPDNNEDYAVRIVENANPDVINQLLADGELDTLNMEFPVPNADGAIEDGLQQGGPGKVYDNPLLR